MLRWLPLRAAQAAVTFALAAVLIFLLMRLAPGDPLSRLTEDRPLPPAAIAELRARFDLNQPFATQLGHYLRGIARGDLGRSIAQEGRPVRAMLAERLPATLLLGGLVLLLNFTVGLAVGVWQAARAGSRADRVVSVITLALYATPSFWLGLVLVWALGIELHLLPVGYMHDPLLASDAGWWARTADLARHLVLPVVTLSLVTIGAAIRYQRAAMIDALALPCIRTARTQGIGERRIRWRHGWRNALGPVVALAGLWLPLLVAGSVFVEAVFSWPGLGTLAAEAIGNRDYPVIMGAALLVTAAVVLGNLVADVLQRLVDPRLAGS